MQSLKVSFLLIGLWSSHPSFAQSAAPDLDSLVRTIYQIDDVEAQLEQYRIVVIEAIKRDTVRVAPLLDELRILSEPADAHLARAQYHWLVAQYRTQLNLPEDPFAPAVTTIDEYLLAGDTTRAVDIYGFLINLCAMRGEFERFDRHIGELTALVETTTTEEARANAALILGISNVRKGNRDEGRQYLEEGLALAENTFPELEGKLSIQLGNLVRQNNYNDAIRLYERALSLAETHDFPDLLAQAGSRLFEVYNDQLNYSEAIRLAELTLDAAEHTSNAQMGNFVRSTVQNGLGLLYTNLSDYESAHPLFEDIIARNHQVGMIDLEFVSHVNYGISLQQAENIPEADWAFRRAVDMVRDIPNPRYQHAAYHYYAQFLVENDRTEEALPYIQSALELNDQVPPKSRQDLARVRALYALETGNYRQAIDLAEGVLTFTTDAGLQGDANIARDILVRSHQQLGNYATALDLLQERAETLEETQEEEQTALKNFVTNQLNRSFEQERLVAAAERDRDLAVARAQTTQTQWLAGGIALLALGALAFFLQGRRTNRIVSERNRQLAVANQTKDRLFGIVGHDLRTPALNFRGITEKVRYLIELRDFDRLDKLGAQIERNAGALHQLTDNLLNWALSQRDVLPHCPRRLDLGQLVREIVALYEPIAREREVQLQVDVPNGQYVHADADTLRAILRNLIDNAIKFTPGGGTVSVGSTPTAQGLQLAVRDTGLGIPADKLDEIFLLGDEKVRPDQQGKRSTGLGLHLVQELVRRNRGHIEVQSEVGRGTSFEVLLPVAG